MNNILFDMSNMFELPTTLVVRRLIMKMQVRAISTLSKFQKIPVFLDTPRCRCKDEQVRILCNLATI